MKTFIRSIINKLGYSLNSNQYVLKPFLENRGVLKLDFDHIISKYLLLNKKVNEPFIFLQIGTFDGIISDPIRKYIIKFNWNGIMLEPQPTPYLKLKKLYSESSNILVLNFALSHHNGISKLYILEGDELPEWSKGMASFSKENILKHKSLINNIDSCIKEIEINTINFEELFNRHSIKRLDLLQIDTEGFDVTVLQLFPFHILKPSIIHFESKHIPKKELEAVLYKLIELGYFIAKDGEEDMTAVLDLYQ